MIRLLSVRSLCSDGIAIGPSPSVSKSAATAVSSGFTFTPIASHHAALSAANSCQLSVSMPNISICFSCVPAHVAGRPLRGLAHQDVRSLRGKRLKGIRKIRPNHANERLQMKVPTSGRSKRSNTAVVVIRNSFTCHMLMPRIVLQHLR